jgi:DNA-binding CsgD family transcriptional regulator
MTVDFPSGNLGKVKKNGRPRRSDSSATKRNAPARSAAGFLLMDSLLGLISFNAEALQILAHPDRPTTLKHREVLLAERIESLLLRRKPGAEPSFVTEFRSGRRMYFCRPFVVNAQSRVGSHPSVAVLLERGPSGLVPLTQVSEQFNLTQREGEALGYLLQGLSSKEIANRMNVSPNTVKAFLRLIMIKTGASSRSAILGKIMMTQTT